MISVITPTYNRAYLLPRMIESVLDQSYKDWELIIMDDGSTDNSKEVVENYRDSRIKYYNTNNSGAADKRNQGVSKAKYENIIFLDSDDTPKNNWLEIFVDKISVNKNAIISCGWEKVDNNNQTIQINLPRKLGSFFDNITLNFLAGSLLLKRSLFLQIGGFDIDLQSGHHTDLLLRLLPVLKRNKIDIINIPMSLLVIYCHSGMKIRTNSYSVYKGTLSLLEKHHLHFKKNKRENINYLAVAGYNALKIHKIKEAKSLLRKAFLIRPWNIKSFLRIIIIEVPLLRKYVWKY
tara:strand:- start:2506 stop:3381 length:876 start_codon:yes stop_codon:yes gene_type:complete